MLYPAPQANPCSLLPTPMQGPEGITGASNYWLDILEPSGAAVAARIWMLDSGNRGCADSPRSW